MIIQPMATLQSVAVLPISPLRWMETPQHQSLPEGVWVALVVVAEVTENVEWEIECLQSQERRQERNLLCDWSAR